MDTMISVLASQTIDIHLPRQYSSVSDRGRLDAGLLASSRSSPEVSFINTHSRFREHLNGLRRESHVWADADRYVCFCTTSAQVCVSGSSVAVLDRCSLASSVTSSFCSQTVSSRYWSADC